MKMPKDPKWLRKWKKQENKAKKNWDAYKARDKALKELGFKTYREYLLSDLWKSIRNARLAMGDSCSCCDGKAEVVHHDTYYKKLLMGDEQSIKKDLYPLCNSCHYRVEFDGARKRSCGEAVRAFRRMLFRYKHGMSKSEMIRQAKAKRKAKRKNRKQEVVQSTAIKHRLDSPPKEIRDMDNHLRSISRQF
jgi:hypothetical protein